jgi:hypothetical protein
MADRFFFEVKGEVHGPIPAQLLEGIASAGLLPLSTPVHIEGGQQWSILQHVVGLPEAPTTTRPPAPRIGVKDLFAQLMRPSEDFICWPKISPEQIKAVRGEYLKLGKDEELLGIYDATIFFKNAANGFALTTRKIAWKNFLGEPECAASDGMT